MNKNPVAKYSRVFNKAKVFIDRKKESKMNPDKPEVDRLDDISIRCVNGGTLESGGLIPHWFLGAMMSDKSIDIIKDNYPWLSSPMEGTIDSNDNYISPYEEDSDLKPLMYIDRVYSEVIIYPYAITAVIEDGTTTIYRLD